VDCGPILGIKYINHLQRHECGNWDYVLAIPILGIFVSNFRFWFFAVQAGANTHDFAAVSTSCPTSKGCHANY
jgi:hypothetical protein